MIEEYRKYIKEAKAKGFRTKDIKAKFHAEGIEATIINKLFPLHTQEVLRIFLILLLAVGVAYIVFEAINYF